MGNPIIVSINRDDGEALVKSIRSTCDNVSQTTVQLLELRKDKIKFNNLSEWTQVRGDMLQLYQDYQQAVFRQDIEKEEGISGRQMKEFILLVSSHVSKQNTNSSSRRDKHRDRRTEI